MVVKPEQERVRTLLSDTITLLCRNGLTYKSKFHISALIGITLDEDDVFLVDIRETIKNAGEDEGGGGAGTDSGSENEAISNSELKEPGRKRRKKHRRSREGSNGESDNEGSNINEDATSPASRHSVDNTVIKRENEDDDSEDLVFIKDEPGISSGNNVTSFGNIGSLSQNQTFGGGGQLGNSSIQQSGDNSNMLGEMSQTGQLYGTPVSSDTISGSQWDPSGSQSSSFSQVRGSGSLGAHSGIQASPSQIPGELYCRYCLRHFKNRPSLQRHEKRHMGIFEYTCSQCGKGCSSKHMYNSHMASVHGQLMVVCPGCGQKFVSKAAMKTHLQEDCARPIGQTDRIPTQQTSLSTQGFG